MSERDLDARVDAVERALTDGDTDLTDLREAGGVADDLQSLEDRLDAVESRLDELEAGLEAVRGYAGNVRAVNREVERRASAALAKAETVEAAVESDGRRHDRQRDRSGDAGRSGWVEGTDGTDRIGAAEGSSGPGYDDARQSDPEGKSDHDRQHDPEERRDRDRPRGGDRRRGHPDERATGGQRRRRDGAAAVGDDRSPSDESPGTGSDEGSQTEQFIERVRDAL
ncbi:DUF7310 family coiled-coil domain-containing protein [Halosimplex marinum]|uniref:DUF7310 family coiled-coil domain-containing protein n=1 Tax=Halosimplex marinum TaxID=3396620 RepID=UPI003F566ABE